MMKGGNTQTLNGFDIDDGNAKKNTHTGDVIIVL